MDEEFNFEKKKFWKQREFFIGLGTAVFLVAILVFGGRILGAGSFFGNFSASIYKTFNDVLGFKSEKPIYELDLAAGTGTDLVLGADLVGGGSVSTENSKQEGGSNGAKTKNSASAAIASGKNSGVEGVLGNLLESSSKKSTTTKEKSLAGGNVSSSPANLANILKDCDFDLSGNLDKRISFNEIAWMGGKNSANDEWLEIKNNSSGEISLVGWQIKNSKGSLKIIFDEKDKISPNGFYLLERTDDNSVPGVSADKIYSGALSNENEWLKFFDSECRLVDEVNASWGWGKFGGDNDLKKTLERNLNDFGWHTSSIVGGTPKAKNSEMVLVSGDAPDGAEDSQVSDSSSTQNNQTASTQNQPPSQNQPGAKVWISEIMAGSTASAGDEFIEIYNPTSNSIDLMGWYIKKKSSSGVESSFVAASRLQGKIIPAGKYFLLAHDGGYAGTVGADVLWPASYSLAYTNNAVVVYNANNEKIEEVSWVEIPKDQSWERESLTEGAGFKVETAPNPQNSSI